MDAQTQARHLPGRRDGERHACPVRLHPEVLFVFVDWPRPAYHARPEQRKHKPSAGSAPGVSRHCRRRTRRGRGAHPFAGALLGSLGMRGRAEGPSCDSLGWSEAEAQVGECPSERPRAVRPGHVAQEPEPCGAPTGEWRLHKTELAQTGPGAARVTFEMIAEPAAGCVEPRVFVFLAFDGARLASVWPLGDQIGG